MVPKSAAAANSAPSSPVTANPAAFYITGGTLPPEASSYVTRQADTDLLAALLAGEYCYVLNSRQMGKSSLCVRTMGALQAAGVRTVFVDLTKLGGSNINAEQWYAGLLAVMGRELGLRSEFLAYWKAQAAQGVGPLPRLFGALEEIALAATDTPVVVFIDEIDATRSLPFAVDEFFIAIRQAYVERAVNPTMKRLTFCLLGTAAPSDLIADTRLSPFNIGRRVEVSDFTPTEAAPLAAGLGANGGALLARVLYWTNGHPYLTQRLCSAIVDAQHPAPDAPHPTVSVDKLCTGLFLTHTARESDNNLTFVRDRLLKSEMDLSALMDMYARIREGGRVADDDTNPLCATLKLAGVARVENGLLHVRNRIYTQVFDRRWVTDHTSPAELRRQQAAYRRGVQRALALAGVIVAVFSGVLAFALQQRNEALRNALLANAKTKLADAKSQEASEKARQNAELAKQRADALAQALAQQTRADHNAADASAQAALAAANAADARNKTLLANRNAALARSQADLARRRTEQSDHNLYTANMNLIQREWENDNVGHVLELLQATAAYKGRGFEWGYWNRLCHLDLKTVHLHASDGKALEVNSIAFSPDGRRIVTSNADDLAKVWDAQTGKLLVTLKGHAGAVISAVFSSDSRRIVTSSKNDSAKVWDAQTGKLLLTLQEHSRYIFSAAFSPDGKYIVTGKGGNGWGRASNSATVWNAQTGREMLTLNKFRMAVGEPSLVLPDGNGFFGPSDYDKMANASNETGYELLTLKGHISGNIPVVFSPDGRRAVTDGYPDSAAKVWDTQTGQEALRLNSPGSPISSAAFSPDGKRIVTSNEDSSATVWNAQTGEEMLTLKGHTGSVFSAVFSPDGRRIVTNSSDKTAKVWDAQTGKLLLTLKGHTSAVLAAVFSPDGRRIFTGSYDGTAKVWDAQTGHEAPTLRGRTNHAADASFSPDGRRLVMGSFGDAAHHPAKVWDTQTGYELLTLEGHTKEVINASFSPDGRRIATGSYDKTAKVWDAQTGKLLVTLKGHTGGVISAVFSPDGRRIVTSGNMDSTARVWDAQTGQEMLRLKGNAGGVIAAVFSPDGRRIATSNADNSAKVWDAQAGKLLLTLKGHTQAISSAIFSPDSKYIVTGSANDLGGNADNSAKVWDTQTGKLLLTLKGHTSVVIAAVFSPDGRRIITSSYDGTAKVWDARSGRELLTLKGHTGSVFSAAFSPDGKRIVTSSKDGSAKVWDAHTGEEMLTIKEHTGSVISAVFSSDGRRIVTNGSGSTINFWLSDMNVKLP